jgi:predicted nucleic acid-binding protein
LKRIVIDASVVLKWYLFDEEHGQTALEILDKYVSYEVELFAPSLLEYEVLNGLLIARKRGRIEKKVVLTAIEGFINLEIEQKNVLCLYSGIMDFSESYGLSAYDSSYLALAREEGASLVTGDETLYHRVKKDVNWIIWLGNYSF